MRVSFWGLLAAAGFLGCVAAALGFLGRVSWILDLFSHFRVQYAAGLGVIGIAMLIGRRWWKGAVILGFTLLNLALVLPLYTGGDDPVSGDGDSPTMRAILMNVHTHNGDPQKVRKVVTEADPDILVLQELNAKWVKGLKWLDATHPHSLVQSREDNFGIGLFSKLPLAESEVIYITGEDAGVPSIVATVSTRHADLRLIATHPLPPVGRDYWERRNAQLAAIPDLVPPSQPVLLLGDLNVTPWSPSFRDLVEKSGLHDSARGFGVQPTWPASPIFLRIPIDHCLHSDHLGIVDRRIGNEVSSDHLPLIIDFVIHEQISRE